MHESNLHLPKIWTSFFLIISLSIQNIQGLNSSPILTTSSRLPSTVRSSFSAAIGAGRKKLFKKTSTTVLSESNNKSNSETKLLQGSVCIVTGASRGVGKGIALELGKKGATVYVTGTSSSSSTKLPSESSSIYTTNDIVGGPGTIEETADCITSLGGEGIPVYCDHSDDEQVKQLFQQVEKEQGRLDMLINAAFRVAKANDYSLIKDAFWEQGLDAWDTLSTVGLRSNYVASCLAVPIMKRNPTLKGNGLPRPFIGMVSSFGGLMYTFNVAYGVNKAAVDRMAKDMAIELEKEDICVCSFWPGMVMTERMKMKVEDGTWDSDVGIPLDNAESPGLAGKAIIAVATDGETNMEKSGTVQIVAEVATEYGFKDENGKQPPSIRSLRFLIPGYALDEETRKKVPDWLIPDWKLPLWLLASGRPPSSPEE